MTDRQINRRTDRQTDSQKDNIKNRKTKIYADKKPDIDGWMDK